MTLKRRFLGILLLLSMLVSLLATPAAAESVGSVGTITLEQVYLNAPQCKFYLYAQDVTGESYKPEELAIAGLQLMLDDDQMELRDIEISRDPITYICVLDLDPEMKAEEFEASKTAILNQAKTLADGEQILVFSADKKPVLVADRNTPYRALEKYFSKLKQSTEGTSIVETLIYVSDYLSRHFQENTSRKICYTFTAASKLIKDPTLIGAMKRTDIIDLLGMSLRVVADTDTAGVMQIMGFMLDLPEGMICDVENNDYWAAMQAENAKLKNAMVITCRISESKIDNSVKVATLSLPRLKMTSSKYVMASHVMVSPAVSEVTLIDRNHIQVNFTRPVYGAEKTSAYVVMDTVGHKLPVFYADPNEGGTSAVLTLGNLYDGRFNVHLRKGKVTDRAESSNRSSTAAAELIVAEGYPKEFSFYWSFLRAPVFLVLLFAAIYGILIWRRNHQEREDEANAQAETILGISNKESKEPTWFGVDFDGDGVVDQYIHDAFAGTTPKMESFSTRKEGLVTKQYTLLLDLDGQTSRRVDVTVEGSLLLGSDPDLSDLAIGGDTVLPQHAILYLDKNKLMLAPVGEGKVMLGREIVTEETQVSMGSTITLGESKITVKKYQGGIQDETAKV